MTDGNIELTRRKILASAGAVGAAGAATGLGTSAFFSDRETFTNNQLVAGELDMKVGYSAHYSDWKENEAGTPEDENVDIRMWGGAPNTTGGPGDLNDDEYGLPANDAWLIAVSANADTPDQDGDGDTDRDDAALTFLENTQTNEETGDASCPDGTDSGDLEQPIIDLDDVKPGDFGEVTFDFALCDNPGFVWLRGGLVDASENDVTEPEADDEDEDQVEGSGNPDLKDTDDDQKTVELLDVVKVAVWLDDGNNYQNGDEDPIFTGSLRDVIVGEVGDATPPGVPLDGDIPPEEGGGTGELNCFSAETEHSVVFAWYVPVDHGNEIQTDTATFDLGFTTQQCRHNEVEIGNNGDTECPPCSFDTSSTGDGASNLLSVGPDPSSGFPDIDARLRVDSPQGNAGDLTAENFAVCEDGCGQTIEDVAFESGGQVDIVVVFDDTGSLGDPIGDLQDEVTNFTDELESAGVDARYALVSFKDNAEVDTDFTTAPDFKTAVDDLSAAGGGDGSEDNVDALAVGTGNAQAQESDFEDPATGGELSAFRSGAQRVLIDITDIGAHDETDDRTRFSQSDVEGFLNDGNFAYYAVAPDATSFDVNKRDIADNVDDGTWIDFSSSADLTPVINDIESDITEEAYVLSYTTTNPATDGSTRTVDIEIDDPDEGLLYEEGDYTAPSS